MSLSWRKAYPRARCKYAVKALKEKKNLRKISIYLNAPPRPITPLFLLLYSLSFGEWNFNAGKPEKIPYSVPHVIPSKPFQGGYRVDLCHESTNSPLWVQQSFENPVPPVVQTFRYAGMDAVPQLLSPRASLDVLRSGAQTSAFALKFD